MARERKVNSHLLIFVNESLILQESDGYTSNKKEHNFAKLLKSVYFSQKLEAILKGNIEKFEFYQQLPSTAMVHFSTMEKSHQEAFESYNSISAKLSILSQRKFGPNAKMLVVQRNRENCMIVFASPAEDYVTMDVTVVLLDYDIWTQITGRN